MKTRPVAVTKGLRTRLWSVIGLAALLLAASSLGGLVPGFRQAAALATLGRTVLALGLVLILMIGIRALRLSNRLDNLIVREELTGLASREYARLRLQEEYYRAKRYDHPLSLLLVDLDNFKLLGDRWGPAAGDHLLRYFGRVILDTVRPSDIAARFSGERFMIVLPDTGRDEALAVAERLRRRLADSPFRIDADREDIRLTVSIGASALAHPEYGQSAEELITMADLALYRARKESRDTILAHSPN